MPTREELYAFFADLADELAPDPSTPPPEPEPEPEPAFVLAPNLARMTIHDVQLNDGDTVARVPITLAEPAQVVMAVFIYTQNGTSANPGIEGFNFTRTTLWAQFNPGDDEIVVDVPVKTSMNGREFSVRANLQQGIWNRFTAIPAYADSRGNVYGFGAPVAEPVVTPIVDDVKVELAAVPNVSNVTFFEDFTNFQASDSGFLADGVTPCWHSKQGMGLGNSDPGVGRAHFNGEVDWICDPALNPGTDPWFIDPATGLFTLQAKHWPDGVPGAPLNDGGLAQWFYSGAMITTKRLFKLQVGDYVEVRLKLGRTLNTWPAVWVMADRDHLLNGKYSPHIEYDMVEGFLNNGVGLEKYATTYHFRDADGNHDSFGNWWEYTGIDPDVPHTLGYWWGHDKLMSFIDDVPYFQAPNMTPHDKQAYLKINLAVGGSGAGTPKPENFPAQMPLEFVRIKK